ncbi:MAG: histidinol phosphate aminotransferase [Pelagimonas sp.]|nr:histidinol phosphate aminotransferase [Pelagimonas sp.]
MQDDPKDIANSPDNEFANYLLIFMNLLWIFGVLWSTWGIVAVIIMGLALNHVISRIAFQKAQDDGADVPPDLSP